MVRRLWSVLLLSVFSSSLIAPILLAQDAESNLPACCRRSGKHGCAQGADGSPSGPAIQAAYCAQFPSLNAAPVNPNVALIAAPRATSRVSLTLFSLALPQESLFFVDLTRAEPQRGPPSLL